MAKFIGKNTLLEEKLYARSKKKDSTNKVATYFEQRRPPNEKVIRKGRKDLKVHPAPILRHDTFRRKNFLCLWCKETIFVEITRGACTKLAPRRLWIHPSSRKTRATTTNPQQQHLGTKDRAKRLLRDVSHLEIPKRG